MESNDYGFLEIKYGQEQLENATNTQYLFLRYRIFIAFKLFLPFLREFGFGMQQMDFQIVDILEKLDNISRQVFIRENNFFPGQFYSLTKRHLKV